MLSMEAKQILDHCTRRELRDHAFGDAEVTWVDDEGREIGTGYFSGTQANVSIHIVGGQSGSFDGAMAKKLRECGTLEDISRNDETGPEAYVEGQMIPALTMKNVFDEITDSAVIGRVVNRRDM